MWKKLRNWLAGPVGRENEALQVAVDVYARGNAALNYALGQAHASQEAMRKDRDTVLGAVAMQQGGQFTLPVALIDAVQNSDWKLEWTREPEGKEVRFTLTRPPEASSEDVKQEGGCGD